LANGIKMTTVCLILGPYRNLTTLTASCLALHPNVQVLNHYRKLHDTSYNFLVNYSDENFETFINKGLRICNSNKSIPGVGGVITASHAFKHEVMRKTYEERYGTSVKNSDNIQCLVWKESHANTNLIFDSVNPQPI